jgi:hypothetical protein
LKRPPDRKFLLAVAILVVAASAMLSRPAALADNESPMRMLTKYSGGR